MTSTPITFEDFASTFTPMTTTTTREISFEQWARQTGSPMARLENVIDDLARAAFAALIPGTGRESGLANTARQRIAAYSEAHARYEAEVPTISTSAPTPPGERADAQTRVAYKRYLRSLESEPIADPRLRALADRAAAIVYPASDELAEYAPAISSADPAIAPMQSHHEIAFLRSELYVTCRIVERHDPRVCYLVGKVNKKTVTDPSGMRFDLLAIRPAKWTESEYRYHLENFWRMTYADNLPPGQSMPWGIEDLPRSQSKDFAAGDRVAIDDTDRPGLLHQLRRA